jgi:hypothetical protein
LAKPDRLLIDELNTLLQDGKYEEAVALMRKDVRAAEMAVLYLRKDVKQRGEALLHREILREVDERPQG